MKTILKRYIITSYYSTRRYFSLLKRKFRVNINPEKFDSGHYYSVIPSLNDMNNRFSNKSYSNNDLLGIELNLSKQTDILEEFKLLSEKEPFYCDKKRNRFLIENDTFSYDDAPILHYFLRRVKPKRIIEIGSGKSSAVMLDTSELYLDNSIEFTFIDLDCSNLKFILSQEDYNKIKIIEKPIQEVPLDVFDSLEAGDLLFIDSSHVSKMGSDLHTIFYRILPRLKRGAYIHFHDIRFPFDYSKEIVKNKIFWNEAYLLRAFLQFNSDFKVHFWLNYLINKDLNTINKLLNFLPLDKWANKFNSGIKNYSGAGGSIYIKRI